MDLELAKTLTQPNNTKIVLCVLDGFGGLPRPSTQRSELEDADMPNLDRLAAKSDLGLTVPVGPGITPGSGPGHLSLFGYDPYVYDIGRGVLEAVGIDFELGPNDVAARGNFCTLAADGTISDRRAGRIATELTLPLLDRLRTIDLPGVELLIEPVRDHRFVLVLRGEGLGEHVSTTDPQKEGVTPLEANGADQASARTAALVNAFVTQATALITDQDRANGLVLRGFAKYPSLPQFTDTWGVRAAALALYPMYRGLAKLAGMRVIDCGSSMEDQIATARERWDEFDYFFIHYKKTDAAGEDGNFDAKVQALNEFDTYLPGIIDLGADVLAIGGDHSTPAIMAAHSWHPVPFLLHSSLTRSTQGVHVNERECAAGSLGTFPAVEVMPLLMAHAMRLEKYGA